MKKILVLYAQYGSGHKTIAEYVAEYLKKNNKNYKVKLMDITPYANSFGKIGVKVMDFVAKKRPEFIFDAFYELLDNKFMSIGHNKLTKRSYDNEELRNEIASFKPDICISSHFYCSYIITYYNDLNIINSKLFTIITDYHKHEIWLKNHHKETGFIVGNQIVKKELMQEGIPSKKIFNFGLPLNLAKINNLDSEKEIFKRYDLKGDKKVYLFFGGSTAGSMYYYDYFKTICKLQLDADIIFISGKNEKLQEKCENYVSKNNITNVKVLGFSNDVFNLLKISDLVISKPGGATVTECLEMKVPMLLVPGVGGQEKYNALFMAKKKYGIKVRGTRKFKKALLLLEKHPNIIKRMYNNLLKLDDNRSVEKINELIKNI